VSRGKTTTRCGASGCVEGPAKGGGRGGSTAGSSIGLGGALPSGCGNDGRRQGGGFRGTHTFALGDEVIRLVGFSEDTSFLRPWDFVPFFVEYLGRSLFVTVAIADLVLRVHLLVWSSARTFAASAAAEEYQQRMGRLREVMTGRAAH
jgi:hypothetical protein